MQQRSPAVIYESPTKNVVLMDIPASLSAPRGFVPYCPYQPLAIPYTLAEPKVQTAFTQELSHTHNRLRASLLEALEDVQQHQSISYCHPRKFLSQDVSEPGQELDFHTNIPFLESCNSEGPIVLENDMTFSDISDILSLPMVASSSNWTTLSLSFPHPPKRFHIPPNSSFLLSSFQTSTKAFMAFSEQLNKFNFILLDPPWPNRSAVRSNAYSTLSRFDMKDLLRLPLGDALVKPESTGDDTSGIKNEGTQDGGLIGIWITNNPKFRTYVLDTLFSSWGVEPAGEWVWLKITAAGEPMFDLESSMRKPYEVLLFGRKILDPGRKRRKRKREVGGDKEQVQDMSENKSDKVVIASAVPGKIILAVPDIHSRKPCIKELIKPYIPSSYRACEIFGRNLTEGWFTWGDEALKFNWEGHWRREGSVEVGHK